MEATGAARRAWRARTSALVSIVFHGVLLALALRVVAGRVAPGPARSVELTAVTVIEPAVHPAPGGTGGPDTSPGAGTGGAPGAMAFSPHDTGVPTGRAARARSQTRAPAAATREADVLISYDTPRGDEAGDEGRGDGSGRGDGLLGDGEGAGYGDRGTGYGVAGLQMPEPPPALPSLARSPIPKHDYTQGRGASHAGTVLLVLTIDPQGVVRNVRILRGADYELDKLARETARRFEFYPALDRSGAPVWGLHRWEFVITQETQWSRWPDHRFSAPSQPR